MQEITNNPLVARSKSYQFIVKSIAAPNPPYWIGTAKTVHYKLVGD